VYSACFRTISSINARRFAHRASQPFRALASSPSLMRVERGSACEARSGRRAAGSGARRVG
jgi:hypothetical protein